MPETIIAALVFAKLKHYNLKPVFKAYALYPLFLLEIFYIGFEICIFSQNYFVLQYAGFIKSAYLFAMLAPIIIYKLYKPALCGSASILVGSALNRLAINANGGRMPVYPSLSLYTGYYKETAFKAANIYNDIHGVGSQATKLKFLTDYIYVGYSILSIGDLFNHAFIFIILFYSVKYLNTNLKQDVLK